MPEERLDKALVSRGLVSSRTRAKRLILEGHVSVDDAVVRDPAMLVAPERTVHVTGDDVPWVSRAALKLIHALDVWGIDVAGKRCLDIGASTGGFTEVLLSRGAVEVTALDVGSDQLADTLRSDPRVRSIEGVHVAEYYPERTISLPEVIVIDVSFISLTKVLPEASRLLAAHGDILALVKPQFEVGKGNTKEGIVVDRSARVAAVERIVHFARSLGFSVRGPLESPIRGGDGNVEYFIWVRR
jgi:23S rRNA (cytidine1920-2'-O)/16S rRNA (cytidine1409-2'-O)-methyltransferase